MQLTWKENYQAAGRKLGMDLTTDPDVVMKPTTAAKILVQGMRGGWFTTKKMSDYANYEDMRRVVNGTDKAKSIADIARQYEVVLVGSDRPAPKPAADGAPGLLQSFFAFLARIFGGAPK